MRTSTLSAALAALTFAVGLAVGSEAEAQQQTQSRLYEVTKNKKLRVCQYPLYYSISFRNPTSGKIEGIDADLAVELAKELGAELEIVESGFATFIADLQANKCEIGMFGVGATLKRAQAVEFSKPYLVTNIYAVTRKEVRSWSVPFQVWLPYASYFVGGIAFHEYPEVPPYPASHGCVRVPSPDAREVYDFASLNTAVLVY